MNTLDNLLDNGIEYHTAIRMLDSYSKKINTMNGIYNIIDINYDFNVRGKNITLQCSECGKTINRLMINSRNKWSELIKGCSCQTEKRKLDKQTDFKNFQKIKKTEMLSDGKSMVGTKYGDYKIIDVENIDDKLLFVLECTECGNTIKAPYKSIKTGAKIHKKCTKHYVQPIKYDESYIGRKNNCLTVIGITRSLDNQRAFECKCDCGNITTVKSIYWRIGKIKSCGCLAKRKKIEHSEELDRLRRIYGGMKQRCYNPNCPNYYNYGGRGIKICQEWQDRENFIEWALKNGYSNDLSIDRIDVNGNYEPSNCRWADAQTQRNNIRPREEWSKPPKKRKLKTVIIDGVERPFAEWYTIYGVTAPTVTYRMKTFGLSFEEALKMPRLTMGRPRKEVI
jgi:hypothetical protein